MLFGKALSKPSPRSVLVGSARRGFLTFVAQYEKGVTLTFGKLGFIGDGVKNPGLRIRIPIFQTMFKVDLRTRIIELESQDVMTTDNVSTRVSAVMYFKVVEPLASVMKVTNVDVGMRQLAQTELRDVLCQKDFNTILESRTQLSSAITAKVEERASKWGVVVEHIQLKNIDLVDTNMIRAMAKQAEATRERTAAVIRADGELKAAAKLVEASEILGKHPAAMELRRLQTLERVSKEPNTNTIVVPLDLLASVKNVMQPPSTGSRNL